MFTLQDGREHLYQWDLDRYIIVEDKTICEVHFCNRTSDCSLVVEVKDGLAPIPNILLQEARPIRAYAYCDDKYTLTEQQFTVKSRTRPDDYVYTETDTITVRDMIDRADKTLEQTSEALANSETALANATAANNTANETIALAQEAVVDMDKLVADAAQSAYSANESATAAKASEDAARGYAERAETAETNVNAVVDTIDSRVDAAVDERITDYYTKEETHQAIADAHEVFYWDFKDITKGGTTWVVATDEQAAALDRLFNGEKLCIYLRPLGTTLEYTPATIYVSSLSIELSVHYTAFTTETFIIIYTASKVSGVWKLQRKSYNNLHFITEDALTDYATKQLVFDYDESVRNDFSETINNYYNKRQTDTAIQNAVDAIDIPEVDFTGYATEEYVNNAITNSGGSCNVPLLPDGYDVDITYLTPGIYGINSNVKTLSEVYCTELNAHVALQWWVSNGMLLIRDRNVVAWGQDNADIMFYAFNMEDYENQSVTLSPSGRLDATGWTAGAVSETRVQEMIDASLGVIENGSY